MTLWTVAVYDQGVEVTLDIIEEPELNQLVRYYERKGYEVRAELTWPEAKEKCYAV
jgi:hypothetical protein